MIPAGTGERSRRVGGDHSSTMATRATQPYRAPGLVPRTQVVENILRGRSVVGFNSQDAKREAQRLARSARTLGARGRSRPLRPRRPQRPPRPPR